MQLGVAGWAVCLRYKVQTEALDPFLSFSTQERKKTVEIFNVKNATTLFNSECCLDVGHFRWSDITLVSLPNSYKQFALHFCAQKVLRDCYKTMCPEQKK